MCAAGEEKKPNLGSAGASSRHYQDKKQWVGRDSFPPGMNNSVQQRGARPGRRGVGGAGRGGVASVRINGVSVPIRRLLLLLVGGSGGGLAHFAPGTSTLPAARNPAAPCHQPLPCRPAPAQRPSLSFPSPSRGLVRKRSSAGRTPPHKVPVGCGTTCETVRQPGSRGPAPADSSSSSSRRSAREENARHMLAPFE